MRREAHNRGRLAPGLMVALLASLLVPSLIVDGRKLQQVQSFEEAQVLAEAFLEDFLREFQNGELGSAAKTEAPAPAPAAGLLGDDIDLADFFGEDFYDEIFGPDAPDEKEASPAPTMAPTGAPTVAPTPSPTQAPRDTVVPVAEVIPEGDPWNPICNVSEVRLPVVHLERRTFNAVDKDVFAVHIPTKYEVKAWAKFRAKVALNETTSSVEPVWDALVGVKSRGKGLRFVQQVGAGTNPEITVCGDWEFDENGIYSWSVYADENAFMDIFFTIRLHKNNGAAAQVLGSFPLQNINVRATSALFVGADKTTASQVVHIDLQGRSKDLAYTLDNRVRGGNNTLANSIVDGQIDYVLADGDQRWGAHRRGLKGNSHGSGP